MQSTSVCDTYKNGYKIIRKKKTKINYNWDDIIYINNFNADLFEIIKRKSRIGANIYHIGYVLDPDYDYNTVKPLYFVVGRLIGYIEEIEGSSDKYLVIASTYVIKIWSVFLTWYGHLLKIKLILVLK